MSPKQLLLVFLCYLLINSVKSADFTCPNGCICEMENNLRAAFCINEKLTTIEAHIPEKVQFLDVSDNMISKLDDYVFKDQNLVQLVILNISSNSLSQISLRAFEKLDTLQIVDLSDNVLHSIPQDVFETNTQLLKLYMSGNKFGFLEPAAIINSPSLQVLDISRCIISHLYQETFSGLPSLTNLDISRNFIIQLEVDTFVNLDGLKSLDFGGNNLNCNQKMTDLVAFLTRNKVSFDNTCQKVEKFQRMVIQGTTTEKSTLLNWNLDDNCPPVYNNSTTCDIIVDKSSFSTMFIVISFVSGILVGVSISCCYINFIYIMKRRKRLSSRRNFVRRSFRQPRDDFLLSENSFNLGLSTPVLPRNNRHNSIIR